MTAEAQLCDGLNSLSQTWRGRLCDWWSVRLPPGLAAHRAHLPRARLPALRQAEFRLVVRRPALAFGVQAPVVELLPLVGRVLRRGLAHPLLEGGARRTPVHEGLQQRGL